MTRIKFIRSDARGATLVEFAIAATVFLTSMFAVIEFGRALWVHNALSDAARRGARYATLHSATDIDKVKNVVVYSNFQLNKGTVTVGITNYQFQFVVPIIGTTIQMPNYTTTLTGESVGWIPADK